MERVPHYTPKKNPAKLTQEQERKMNAHSRSWAIPKQQRSGKIPGVRLWCISLLFLTEYGSGMPINKCPRMFLYKQLTFANPISTRFSERITNSPLLCSTEGWSSFLSCCSVAFRLFIFSVPWLQWACPSWLVYTMSILLCSGFTSWICN